MRRVDELFSRHMDANLTPEEEQELREILRDPVSRDRWRALALLEGGLQESLSGGQRMEHETVVSRRSLWGWALAAAASLAILLGAWWAWQGRSDEGLEPVVAQVGAVTGAVEVRNAECGTRNLASGAAVGLGDTVLTGTNGEVELIWKDGTRIVVRKESEFGLAAAESDLPQAKRHKALRLEKGGVVASVAKQPEGRPMTISMPRAEATVLGTRLTLAVATNATRLDVSEGLVRFTRMDPPISMEVSAGGYVLAKPEITFSANARRLDPGKSLRVIEDHEGLLAWRPLPDCAPVAFRISPVAHSGRNGLRVTFEPKAGDRWSYGEIAHAFVLKPGDRVLRFFINVERYDGNANWTIQFRQRDRNCWMIGEGFFADLGKGWNLVELEIPRVPVNVWGGGTYRPDEVQELLFAVCVRAAAFTIDDFAVSGGEQP